MFAFVSAFPKSLHCTDEAQQAETVRLSAVIYIYIYIHSTKNPRRASVRAETRTYGTDLPSRLKSCALSITPSHRPQKKTAQ